MRRAAEFEHRIPRGEKHNSSIFLRLGDTDAAVENILADVVLYCNYIWIHYS